MTSCLTSVAVFWADVDAEPSPCIRDPESPVWSTSGGMLPDVFDELMALVRDIHTMLRLGPRKTMNVREAARYADMEPGTIRRWLADGRLRGVKVGDVKQSRWRIRKQDLDQVLSRNTNHPE